MIHSKLKIINKLGLHARAAAKFAKTAAQFSSRVETNLNGQSVNGKSVMSLMLLAASNGTSLDIYIEGDDEKEATQALVTLVRDKFGEYE